MKLTFLHYRRIVGMCLLFMVLSTQAQLIDSQAVPGMFNPGVNQSNVKDTICKTGWTGSVRPPTNYTDALKWLLISSEKLARECIKTEFEHVDSTSEDARWTLAVQNCYEMMLTDGGYTPTPQEVEAFKRTELDHKAALTCGGHPYHPDNLWLQHWNCTTQKSHGLSTCIGDEPESANKKDAAERRCNAAVCSGNSSLIDAQNQLITDWHSFEKK